MIVVDVETGGLDPNVNPLLSIGAVDYNTGEVFEVKLSPGYKQLITEEAKEVNGYTPEKWLDAHSVYNGIRMFDDWLKGRDSKVLAGHNPSFDLSFLREAFREAGVVCPFGHRTIDLHTLAYTLFGKSLTSDQIYIELGMIPEPRPHLAINGAHFEYEAFKLLFRKLRL